jgi:hypothetical protein
MEFGNQRVKRKQVLKKQLRPRNRYGVVVLSDTQASAPDGRIALTM